MEIKLLLTVAALLCLTACSSLTSSNVTVTSFPGLDRSQLKPEQAHRLDLAETDLNRLRSGQEPVHARFETSLRDGGTRYYIGDGYRLIALKRIERREGLHGWITGPSITLDRTITGQKTIHYEETRFEILRSK